MAPLPVEFHKRPSALAFMLNALRPSPGLDAAQGFPALVARWRGHRIDGPQLADFLELTGLRANAHLPLIYPHVFGFRLQMAILTHPAFPLPIWGALQIRNHLLQHQPITSDGTLDLETRVAAHRLLEKGAEVDLHTTVRVGAEAVWESLNTFYYRGRLGAPGASSPLSRSPDAPQITVARWLMPTGVGWRFARLTGDYNGIHRWHWYARRLGFRKAFFHPQMVIGQCMARLAGPEARLTQRLDVWLKGPVYFGSNVSLRLATAERDAVFALIAEGEERPAILGRWSRVVQQQERLIATEGAPNAERA